MLRPLSHALASSPAAGNRPADVLCLAVANADWTGTALRHGLDFATSDCLALGRLPAIRAVRDFSSPDPADRVASARLFAARLAGFLQLPAVATFASGALAIRQTLRALLRSRDDVIVDAAADPAMFETAFACGAHLHRTPAGSLDGVERRVARLSRRPGGGRIFICVPAVSAQASRISDLAELASLARRHDATLIVDVSQDLGAMGQSGGGVMEIQGCLGRIDVVLGSLAGPFVSAGGFAAFRNPAHRAAVSRLNPDSSASQQDVAVPLAALELIASPEGRRRRRNLHGLALRLRNHLMSDGIRVLGQASPCIPILLPPLTALPRTALLESAGPRVPLLQAPFVPLHAPRWRIQLTAEHSLADIDDLAELIRDVTRAFDRSPARATVPA